MPSVLVRDVEASLLEKLKVRAKQNGRSLQGEVLFMMRQFVNAEPLPDAEVADKIKDALRGRSFSDSAELLREERKR